LSAQSFFAFDVQNIQVIFHIKLKQILFKSVGSLFICYPIDPYYLFSDSDKNIMQTEGRIVF